MNGTDEIKNPIPIKNLIKTIQYNCDISDAVGSSIFSICGMALRLRDLNKWEKGYPPWKENRPEDLVAWIDAKEQLWDKLDGRDFSPLSLNGKTYDPFDTAALNKALSPARLFYGAGYAHSLKPTFFLSEIEEKQEIEGIHVIFLGRERIRDLLTIPALNQDNCILIRREAARLFLWDQMAYLKKSGRRFLHFALKACGLPDTGIESRKTHFESILSTQEQTYIYHEVGEIKDTVFDHDIFRKVVAEFPHSPVELLARTLKDILADTGPKGTLNHIISSRDAAGLGFYAAFQDGLFRPLFPELRRALEKFVPSRDWNTIEDARQAGYNTAKRYTRDLIDLYMDSSLNNDRSRVAERINETLVQPLTEIF